MLWQLLMREATPKPEEVPLAHSTNNTSEIIGIEQALMWLWDIDELVDTTAVMMFGDCYAINTVMVR